VSFVDQGCADQYVDFDPDPILSGYGVARLVSSPVYRTPADWGVVYLNDDELMPRRAYSVASLCEAGPQSGFVSATTWAWADVGASHVAPQPDLDDVIESLDAFAAGPGWAEDHPAADLLGQGTCVPDGIVDLSDIAAVLDAYAGGLYPCPDPCD
jgi:hypothetical protein